jgi:hypothetical protein
MHVVSKMDRQDPKRTDPTTENVDPRLTAERSRKHPRTDSADPICIPPNTDKAEPKRQKLLKDKHEPKCKKSNTDKEDPNRNKLRRERADAR